MNEELYFNDELRKCLNAAGLSGCGENDAWNYWYHRVHKAHDQAVDRVTEAQRAENAKLRELCADMWHVMWACAEQRCKHRENECYVVNGNNGALPSHDECWYKRRMRELGVDE